MKEKIEIFDSVVSTFVDDGNNTPKRVKFCRYGRTIDKPFARIDNALNTDGQLPYTGVITVDDLQIVFGRKWKQSCKMVMQLCKYIYTHFVDDKTNVYREISISTTDAKILANTKTTNRQLARIFRNACKINVLKCTNAAFSVESNGRYYIFNALIYKQLQNLLGIDIVDIEEKTEVVLPDADTTINNKRLLSCRFGKGLRIDGTDGEIIAGLYAQYPLLKEYQAKVEKINNRLDCKLLKMSFTPSIKRRKDGYAGRLGIRCTSPFCQTTTADRDSILSDLLGFDKIYHYHYDVKSSIYRVSYWLHTGMWANDDIDFYCVMPPAKSTMSRDAYKSFAMRLYFESSADSAYNHFANAVKYAGIDNSVITRSLIHEYYQAMRAVIGESVGSEIFLYESMLYIDLLDALMQLGYKVAQVYDCFYSDNENIAYACKELLPALATVLYQRLGKTPQKGVDLAALMMARGNTTDKHTDAVEDAMDAVADLMNKATEEQEQEQEQEQENKALTEGEFVDAVMQKPKSTPESRAAWEQREAERQAEKSMYDAYIKEMATATENATEKPASPTPDNVANIVDCALTSAKTDASSDDDGDKWACLDAYGIA